MQELHPSSLTGHAMHLIMAEAKQVVREATDVAHSEVDPCNDMGKQLQQHSASTAATMYDQWSVLAHGDAAQADITVQPSRYGSIRWRPPAVFLSKACVEHLSNSNQECTEMEAAPPRDSS